MHGGHSRASSPAQGHYTHLLSWSSDGHGVPPLSVTPCGSQRHLGLVGNSWAVAAASDRLVLIVLVAPELTRPVLQPEVLGMKSQGVPSRALDSQHVQVK